MRELRLKIEVEGNFRVLYVWRGSETVGEGFVQFHRFLFLYLSLFALGGREAQKGERKSVRKREEKEGSKDRNEREREREKTRKKRRVRSGNARAPRG